MPRTAVLAALSLLLVPAAGCIGTEQAPPTPASTESEPDANRSPLPGTFTYECPAGEGTRRDNGVCARTIADPTTSLQEPYLAVPSDRSDLLAIGANAIPTTDAVDPGREAPGVELRRAVILVSQDGGGSWSTSQLPYVPEDDAGPADVAESWAPRPSWGPGGALTVSALATQKSPVRGGDVLAARSTDRGQTWSTPTVLTSDDDNDGYWISRGPDDTLYRPWTDGGSDSSVELAWRSPGSDGWTRLSDGGAATDCTTTSAVAHQAGTPYLVCTREAEQGPAGLDEDPTGLAVHRLDRSNRSLERVGQVDGIPGYYPDLIRTDDGTLHVATEANGTILAASRPGPDQGWTEAQDLRERLEVEDDWTFADLHYWKQGPTGAVHLLLYGAQDTSSPAPTPVVAHAALSEDLEQVLAERVLWTGEPDPDQQPRTLAPRGGSHAFGIAFANGTGYLAWTQDGTIGLTRLDPVSADEPFPLTVDGDGGPGCPADHDGYYCFEQVRGRVSALAPGQPVELTFRNTGQDPHDLLVTRANRSDPSHENTPKQAAFAATDTISAGESTTVNFTVPADADGLYLWCNVGRHEAQGMWLEANLTAPPAGNATAGSGSNASLDAADPPGLGPGSGFRKR